MFEFQNSLYRSVSDMTAAVAQQWLTADGHNDTQTIQQEILPGETPETLADTCISAWGLDQPNTNESGQDEGRTWMQARSMERDDLVAAFKQLIQEYDELLPVQYSNSRDEKPQAWAKFDDFTPTSQDAICTGRVLDGSSDHGYAEEWQVTGVLLVNNESRQAKATYLFTEQEAAQDADCYPWDHNHVARFILVD